MLKNYFKIAIRNLVKHKGYSFINISGLAIGISLCLLILMYVKHELSYDRFNEKAERIVRVNMVDTDGEQLAVTPSLVAPSISAIAPEIEKWVRLYEPTRYSPVIVKAGANKFQEDSFFYADSSFFDIYSFRFLAGNPATALKAPRSLVLTKSSAEKLFGTVNAVGNTVDATVFNSEYVFEVTAVIEDVPSNSHFSFDYLGSLNTMSGWSQLTDTEIAAANFYTYFLLTSPDALNTLQEKTDAFIEKNIKEQRDVSLVYKPLTELYLNSEVSENYEIAPMGSKSKVYGFILLAFMVLLIATINYINLSTARSSRRGSEVGIRKALGAVRSQLVKQFYGESLVITLLSVALAIILVEVFKDAFFGLMGQHIEFDLMADRSTWVLLFGVVLITSTLAGSYPAFLLSSYQPVKVLKGILGTSGSDGTLRKGLVVSQFAISTFLILSTAIIFRQTDFILTSNLGFEDEQIIVLPARDNQLSEKQDLLKSEILRQPGVLNASYMSNVPGKIFGGYTSQHLPDDDEVSTLAGAADKDLVETMGMHLLAGNGFPKNPGYDIEQGFAYLLNEKLISKYGWTPEEAIGKKFNVVGDGEVVGVLKDFNIASLHEEVSPLVLFMDGRRYNYLMVKISPDNVDQSLASIENVWEQIAPHRPFEFDFLDQQLNALYKSDIRTRNLLSLFSGLAIFIACLGLIGLSSYLIERRSKEIGIRKVLGASISGIVSLLSFDFLKLVGIGFLIGAPLAWFAMENYLQNFAFRINIGIAVFIIAAVIAVLATIATVSWQSIRAALANPVESLKSE